MPSEATNNATRREWRELGFFYDRDDENKVWRLTGSRAGLLRFAGPPMRGQIHLLVDRERERKGYRVQNLLVFSLFRLDVRKQVQLRPRVRFVVRSDRVRSMRIPRRSRFVVSWTRSGSAPSGRCPCQPGSWSKS